MFNISKKRILVEGLILFSAAYCQVSFADNAYFPTRVPEIDGIEWSKEPIAVEETTESGKIIHKAMLKGVFKLKDWSLISEKAPDLSLKDIDSKEDEGSKSLLMPIVLDDGITHVKLSEVSPAGDVKAYEFDIAIDKGPRVKWEPRIQIAIPFGNASSTTAAGSSTSVALLGNAYELGGELRYSKVKQMSDRAFEASAIASIMGITTTSGLGFPVYWKGGFRFMYRNLWATLFKSNTTTSPFLTLQAESIPSASNLISTSSSGLSYQVRALYASWIGLGARFRWEGPKRWLEVTPSISYSPWARSFLTTTGGDFVHTGWKLNVTGIVPVWKKVYAGVDFTWMTFQGTNTASYLAGSALAGWYF